MKNRYRLLELLGQGGMGQVYQAIDQYTHQTVAIKTMIPDKMQDRVYAHHAFYQEACIMASLQHPNLVKVHDFGFQSDEIAYICMEWINGYSLEEFAKHNILLPWPILAHITSQILSGISHAHARGVIHRDLKPSNIMLELQDPGQLPVVKIIDFGIALLAEERYQEWEQTLGETTNSHPVPPSRHQIKLTPPYGAPEQLQDPHYYKGPATDLYALGVILFQFCYNQLPFIDPGKDIDYMHVLYRMVRESPPTHLPIVNDTPQSVADIVLFHLMPKTPWQRIHHALILQHILRSYWNIQDAVRLWPTTYEQLMQIKQQHLAASCVTTACFPVTSPWPSSPLPHTARNEARLPENTTFEIRLQTSGSGLSLALLLAFRSPPLCGRHKAQEFLQQQFQFLQPQVSPHKQMVLLTGEAGAGKSRMAQWFVEYCYEYHAIENIQVTFQPKRGPLQGIESGLERYFGWNGAPRHRIEGSLMERWKSKTPTDLQIIAGVAALLRPADTEESSHPGPSGQRILLERAESRHQIRLSILTHIIEHPIPFDSFDGNRPLILWLNNIEWTDPETLDFLQQLWEHPTLSVFIVTTARTDRLSEQEKRNPRLQEILHLWNKKEYVLGPLSFDEMSRWLREWLHLEPNAEHELYARSRGNPLLTLQQVYAWALHGHLRWDITKQSYHIAPQAFRLFPQASKTLWEERLQILSPSARWAATCLTTLGSELLPSLVDHLCEKLNLPPNQILHELLEYQFLIPEYQRLIWYHSMLEEYLSLQLHQDARAIEVFEIAFQVLEQHPQAHERSVVRLRVDHAIKAKRYDHAFDTMMTFIEKEWHKRRDSRMILEDLDLIASHVPSHQTAYFWRWQTEVLIVQTEIEQAAQVCDQLIQKVQQEDFPLELAHALRLHATLLDIQGAVEGKVEARQHALSLATQALEQFERCEAFPHQAEKIGQAETRLLLANIQYNLSNYQESITWARTAIQSFERHQLPRGAAQSLMQVGFSFGDLGKYREASFWIQSAFQRYQLIGDTMGIAQCHFWWATLSLYRKDFSTGQHFTQHALQYFSTQGIHWWLGATCILQGWSHLCQQQHAQAQEQAQKALHLFQKMALQQEQGHALLLQSAIFLQQEQPQDAIPFLEQVEEFGRPEPLLCQILALMQSWYYQQQQLYSQASIALKTACTLWREHSLTAFCVPPVLDKLREFSHWPDHILLDFDAWLESLRDLRDLDSPDMLRWSHTSPQP